MRLLNVILFLFPGLILTGQNDKYEAARMNMVETQIVARGITDEATLKALRKVPRHLFVHPSMAREAYSDKPLPIGYNQTISQPLIVAHMTELVRTAKGKKALGDGYIGWQEHAPFDMIIVTAAADHIPQPLKDQLAEGGRLVMPVGDPDTVQQLILLVKKKGKIIESRLEHVRFVPLKRIK